MSFQNETFLSGLIGRKGKINTSGAKMTRLFLTVRNILAVTAMLAFLSAGRANAETNDQIVDTGTQAAGTVSEELPASGTTQTVDAASKCDALAADPEDRDKPAGIRGIDSVSPDAVAPCSLAVDADPQNARLNYQAGRAYAQAGEHTKAFFHFDRASSLGSIRATVAVASAYMAGAGVGKDEGKALEMYKRAASQGDNGAAIEVGKYYSDGPSRNLELAAQWLSEVKTAKGYIALGDLYAKAYKNDAISLKWYRKAAEFGDSEASFKIGDAYFTGKGVPRDVYEALKWFEAVAEKSGAAAFAVSAYYREGWVGSKDEIMEVKWLRKSMNLKWTEAYQVFGNYYLGGYDSALIHKNFDAGVYILKKGASIGCIDCADQLGEIYSGRYPSIKINYDTEEAVKWYLLAAEGGKIDAYGKIGRTYAWSNDPDYSKALEWYRKGVILRDVLSISLLGDMYREGNGVAKNGKEAVNLYEKAALFKYKRETASLAQQAMKSLGDMYRMGDGVEKNPKLAMEWYKKAALAGSGYAMNQVGILYHDGVGVKQDYVQAGKWYEKAAEVGFAWGDRNLAILFSRGQGARKDVSLAVGLLETALVDSDVCDDFKRGWNNWTGEFIRALQSRLAAKYGYTGSIDGKLGSGSLKAFDAMCKAKSG